MAAKPRCPWMGSVSVSDANPHSLYDLLVAAFADDATLFTQVNMVEVQIDPDATVSSVFFGNSDVASSMWGKKLVPGQSTTPIKILDSHNPVDLRRIYVLLSSAVATVFGLTIYQN